MKKEFYFLQVIHFHQPVGNFDSVIERACRRCYEPFLEAIADFPDIKFNLHYSGCLLEWFKNKNPAILSRIKGLVRAGQVELLGGGFYEPIFSNLPIRDSIEQIKMLSSFLKDEFGVSAKGAWLPERVWEPHLAGIFERAGIRYTIVDDTHLRYSGLKQNQLYGYYVTEENGKCLNIFPSDKFLRYTIPFKAPKETLNYFFKVRDKYKGDCVLYGDDGEKFGEWPGTQRWVYEKKWLYKFLKLLRDNSSWLKTEKISRYMKDHTAAGRIYLPTASYQEMSEWSLPADSACAYEYILKRLEKQKSLNKYIDFVRGGFWRNFLIKYPESNQMHKRMLMVSKRLRRVGARLPLKGSGGQAASRRRTMIDSAKKELFRSQCNCAYWHGVFGGLYLYHLRQAVYEHIISADKILDSVENKRKNWLRIERLDFDCDGQKEFIVSTPQSTFIIDTAEGATITEWDIKKRSLNIVNTISRKKEAYHRRLKQLASKDIDKDEMATIHKSRLSKKDIAKKQLYYDNSRRVLFKDCFLPERINLKQVISGSYRDKGDFIDSAYSALNTNGRDIRLKRTGQVDGQPIEINKQFFFTPNRNRVNVSYKITNLSQKQVVLNFAPELNFSLTKDSINKELKRVSSLVLRDNVVNFELKLRFSEKADKVFRYCVNTISQSERGAEENYQATCILPVFRVKLGKKQTRSLQIDILAP